MKISEKEIRTYNDAFYGAITQIETLSSNKYLIFL